MDVREKLVELIESARYWGSNTSEEIAENLLEKGVTVQEWISVDDRLPENGVYVLLCCEVHGDGGEIVGKYICVGYYAEANKIVAYGASSDYACDYSEEDDEFYLCEGWYETVKNCDNFNSVAVEDFVTHWMHLPEPPKEVEE